MTTQYRTSPPCTCRYTATKNGHFQGQNRGTLLPKTALFRATNGPFLGQSRGTLLPNTAILQHPEVHCYQKQPFSGLKTALFRVIPEVHCYQTRGTLLPKTVLFRTKSPAVTAKATSPQKYAPRCRPRTPPSGPISTLDNSLSGPHYPVNYRRNRRL
jgi:hypothetical protein